MASATPPHVRGWRLLESLVDSLPLPDATPDRSTREALGMHLVASSMRRDHVERVTERISLVDATHMARVVDVDVNLGTLSPDKLEALTVTTPPGADGEGGGRPESSVWVPVARHPRFSLGPVQLRDGNGGSVARVPSTETNRLLGTGLVRMLAMLEDQLPADRHPSRGSDRLPRWIVQSALLTAVQEGQTHARPAPRRPGTDATAPHRARAHGYLRRLLAIGSLGRLDDVQVPEHAFLALVDALSYDQVILAEVPSSTRRLQVSYQAPEMRAAERHAWASSLRSPGEFTFRYDTVIPADVDSFHVMLRVPEDIEVRRFLLTSNADQHVVESLAQDVASLRTRLDATRTPSTDRAEDETVLVAHELRSVRARLGELGRRRMADLGRYLADAQRPASRPLDDATRAAWPPPGADPTNLRALTATGRHLASRSATLAAEDSGDPDPGGRDVDLPRESLAATLGELAGRLAGSDLGWDLHSDNDPAETSGHVQWRRFTGSLDLPRHRPVNARVLVTLTDARPSHALQVLALLLGNGVLVSLLLASLSAQPADAGTEADVAVTLLLLVPGILVGRLGTQVRRSIPSSLLQVSQWLAYLSMAANVGLALAVISAGPVTIAAWPFVAPVAFLAVCLVLAGVHVGRSWRGANRAVAVDEGVPRWLPEEQSRGAVPGPTPVSVTFVEVVPVHRDWDQVA